MRMHIVGGGVAGLALAGLLPTDWEIHLHEPGSSTRPVPTLFGIQAGGQSALAELGLLDALRSHSAAISSGFLYDATGAVLTRMKNLDVRLIPRTELLGLLDAALPGNVQRHRHPVNSVADLDDGRAGGTPIIGADGVHSVIRRDLWPRRSAPQRLPVTAIRGVVDDVDLRPILQEIWRPGGLFGMTPRPGGGVNWFATMPRQRFAGEADALEALRSHWSGLAEDAVRVLQHATPEHTLVNDLWQSRWPGRLVRGHAALIGDAAHAMAPNLGRGANESLVDALTLGRALRIMPVRQAFQDYQRRRLLPSQIIKHASLIALKLSATQHERARNALLAAIPSSDDVDVQSGAS